MTPAGTTNRKALPWAGLATVALVLLLDRTLVDQPALFERAVERIPPGRHLERGLANDRLELQRADEVAGAPRVFLVGTSRALAAVRPELHARYGEHPPLDADWFTLAHAQLMPLEVAALSHEIASREPAVVVWVLSEFETHQPLRIVDRAAPAGVGGLLDLLAATDLRFALGQRTPLARLLLGGLLDAYAFRDVFGRAGLDGLRRFAGDERLAARVPDSPPTGYGAGERLPLDARARAALLTELDALYPALPDALRGEIEQIRAITRGRHAAAHAVLVERAVERLTDAGARVVIVELDVHPRARVLYDRSIADEFAALARRLVDEHDVLWITREELGDFGDGDFRDLTHLDKVGSLAVSERVVAAVGSLLEQR